MRGVMDEILYCDIMYGMICMSLSFVFIFHSVI